MHASPAGNEKPTLFIWLVAPYRFQLCALSFAGRFGLPPAQYAPNTAASAKSGTYA